LERTAPWLGSYRVIVKTFDISEFREQCLAILEELTAEGVLITKRGRPVARIVPIPENDGDLIGRLAGQLEINGEVFTTGEHWEAES
jgi:prevent-host-death family protein